MLNLFKRELLEDHDDHSPTKMVVRGIQFHFHSPSEHTIDGKEFKLELHIVHKLMYTPLSDTQLFDKWRYVVTAVFFDTPTNMNALNETQIENMEFVHKFMEKIVKVNPEAEPINEAETNIDLQALMAKVNRNKRWIYRGSFTTPPCTEGVLWNVVDDVLMIKPETLEMFMRKQKNHQRGDLRCLSCGGNNRKVYPLNDRKVYYVTECSGKKTGFNQCRI